jgi:hypothetical protein
METTKLDLIQNKIEKIERELLKARRFGDIDKINELKEELQWAKKIERTIWEKEILG